MSDRPKVGIAVFIVKDGKILMGQRKGSHGEGMWAPPGGHLEFGETWEQCAIRETHEEVNVEIKNIRFLAVTNDVFQAEQKHYVTIFLLAEWSANEASIMEPEKCSQLAWLKYENLPDNILLPIKNLEQMYPDIHIG